MEKKAKRQKVLPRLCICGNDSFDDQGNLKKGPWYKIKETDGVINFIGKRKPTPSPEDEIGRILRQVNEAVGKEVPKG